MVLKAPIYTTPTAIAVWLVLSLGKNQKRIIFDFFRRSSGLWMNGAKVPIHITGIPMGSSLVILLGNNQKRIVFGYFCRAS